MRKTCPIASVVLPAIGAVGASQHGDKISLPPAFAALGLGTGKVGKAQAKLEFVERGAVRPLRPGHRPAPCLERVCGSLAWPSPARSSPPW